jgi:hypothetical protein
LLHYYFYIYTPRAVSEEQKLGKQLESRHGNSVSETETAGYTQFADEEGVKDEGGGNCGMPVELNICIC